MAHQIDGPNTVPVMPAPAAPGTPGWFGPGLPGTIVMYDWANMVQAETLNAAALVDTPDKGDHTQVARAIQAAVVGGAVSVGAATTEHVAAVMVSDNCGVFGTRSAAIASEDGAVNGDICAIVASSGCDHDGDSLHSLSAASLDADLNDATLCATLASDSDQVLETFNSAAIAGNSNFIQYGSNHLIAAGDSNVIQALSGVAIIASHESQIGPGSPTPGRCVILASRGCAVELGTASTPASASGGRQYVVAGAYNSGGLIAPLWRLESHGGYMRSFNAHTTSGLDYAETFENGDGNARAPGRLVTLDGHQERLAQPGEMILGARSSSPSIIGGDDGLAWAHRHERDKFGAPVWEEVDATQQVPDFEALKAWKAQVKELKAQRRAAKAAKRRDSVRALTSQIKDLKPPARVTFTERVRQMKVSEKWDPTKPQVSRIDRPTEHTVVGLLGQIRLCVGADVKVGDMLMPGVDGVGVPATREYLMESWFQGGARARVMKLTSDYDKDDGFAVALCLVR